MTVETAIVSGVSLAIGIVIGIGWATFMEGTGR